MADPKAPTSKSAERESEVFSAYVFFNEALDFTMAEVLDAYEEDYPGLPRFKDVIPPQHAHLSTAETATVVLLADHPAVPSVHLFWAANNRDWNMDGLQERSGRLFPEAAEAVRTNQGYISISAGGEPGLATRFIAARIVTCLAAVFAGLPVATAIYWSTGGLICSPQHWISAAKDAAEDKIPTFQWVAFDRTSLPATSDLPAQVSVESYGMAPFNGHEVCFTYAPQSLRTVGGHTASMVWMLLQAGHQFGDGDTVGLEGSDVKHRIRLAPEGPLAAVNTWVVLHPASPVDEMEIFGERQGRPPPPEDVDKYTHRGDARYLGHLVRAAMATPTAGQRLS
ncbi:MAG: hypothetical protein AAGC81_06780 [Pseudomonadota bacterium]